MLPGSAPLPFHRNRFRRPPARGCWSRTATATPGTRSTSRRSCRIAQGFAVGTFAEKRTGTWNWKKEESEVFVGVVATSSGEQTGIRDLLFLSVESAWPVS